MGAEKTWFIEAVGHTNEVIAAELPAENAARGVLCKDGVKRDLWRSDYRFIARLVRSTTGRLPFTVFYREGPYGPVKPWPFLPRPKPTLVGALKCGAVKRASALVTQAPR